LFFERNQFIEPTLTLNPFELKQSLRGKVLLSGRKTFMVAENNRSRKVTLHNHGLQFTANIKATNLKYLLGNSTIAADFSPQLA
jgi:hypothetical protein